jgi:hypothetical protein
MLRCLKPGCPTGCGTRRMPSCADRVLCHRLLFLLTAAFLVSLGMGLMWLNEAARDSGRVPESPPVATPETLELVSETKDNGHERILSDRDGAPAFSNDAPVQIPKQR